MFTFYLYSPQDSKQQQNMQNRSSQQKNGENAIN